MFFLCPNCNSFPLEDCVWCKQVTVPVLAKVFKTHAVPQGVCENLISALKLLANQQKDGDRPIQSIVTRRCEKKGKA